MSILESRLQHIGCDIDQKYPMNKYTTLRVGGLADLVVTPNSIEEFIKVLNLLSETNTPRIILGAGSNTVVGDEGIEGVVVCTRKLKDIRISEDDKVFAETGAVLGTILNKTIKAGLAGFEFAAGIPGTVGGGIFMNAGANNGEIKDVLETVWVWLDGKEIAIDRSEIKFEYRKSHLPEGCVIIRAVFRLNKGNKDAIEENVKEYMERRNQTQPIKMSNTGSIFKNPPEIPAGKLLEELGLKGFGIGGARFSELHANFIVNSGDAKASDVLSLIEKAKEEALLKRGIKLETEVKIIGKEKSGRE